MRNYETDYPPTEMRVITPPSPADPAEALPETAKPQTFDRNCEQNTKTFGQKSLERTMKCEQTFAQKCERTLERKEKNDYLLSLLKVIITQTY